MLDKELLKNFSNKKPKQLFKEPLTSTKFYGKDQPGAFILQGKGQDIFTSHLTQTYDWDKHNFEYTWNSLGLRGPEPDYDASTKILLAGGSNSFGTGVPVEYSFPWLLAEKMQANYINISDVDCLSDLINPLEKFVDYNPDYVIINDTRFIQLYGWMMIDLYKIKDIENTQVYKEIFKSCDQMFLKTFECYVKVLFPNSQIYFVYSKRRAWKDDVTQFKQITPILLDSELYVDIGRDNTHPGIESNINFAEKIYNSIM